MTKGFFLLFLKLKIANRFYWKMVTLCNILNKNSKKKMRIKTFLAKKIPPDAKY